MVSTQFANACMNSCRNFRVPSLMRLPCFEVQEIAQNPEQRHVVRSVHCIVAPVDVERYHLSSQSLRMEHCLVGKITTYPISTPTLDAAWSSEPASDGLVRS